MQPFRWQSLLGWASLILVGTVLARAWGFSLELQDLRAALAHLLLAPVLEEFVFRAQIQQTLEERWGRPGNAMLVATALFVSIHLPWMGWHALWLIAPGLALGAAWRAHRNLVFNIGLHSAFNGSLAMATLVG